MSIGKELKSREIDGNSENWKEKKMKEMQELKETKTIHEPLYNVTDESKR